MPYEPFDLTGKVVLITGGNGGIGLGMAHGVAAAGADVCIWGTNEAKNTDAEKELREHGVRVLAQVCDVGDEEAVERTFADSLAELGRVDACFANAAVTAVGNARLSEYSTEEWHRVLRVNLDGVFFTLRAAARHMLERGGGGSLVAVSSVASIHGQPRAYPYGASKGAINSFIRGLAVELGPKGIRANALLPAWTDTPAFTPLLQAEDDFAVKWRNVLMGRIPMKRWGLPSDFGGIAVYLTSDASAFHTGDSIVLDGGYSIF